MLDLGKLPMKFANTSDECSVINVEKWQWTSADVESMEKLLFKYKKKHRWKKKINSRFKVKQFLRNKICEELPE